MGCINGNVDTAPETCELGQKQEALRKLWIAGSIWTGKINFDGIESPWEVHVDCDSTPNKITARRIVNFIKLTHVTSLRVDFELGCWGRKHKEGKCPDIITFYWEDEDYTVYADTSTGILDVSERRIKGLIVDNKTNKEGVIDFYRVLAQNPFNENNIVRMQSVLTANSERNRRIFEVLDQVNKTTDKQHRRFTGAISPESTGSISPESVIVLRETFNEV